MDSHIECFLSLPAYICPTSTLKYLKLLFQLLRENRVSAAFALGLVSIPLLFSSSVATYIYLHQNSFYHFSSLEWGAFYLITIFTMGLAITPTTFIAFLGGYFLSWYSLPYMIPAYLLASLLCYYLSQQVDQGKLMKNLSQNPSIRAFISKANRKQLPLVIYSKLSPALPFALSNFLLAVLKVRVRTFLLGCLIGMLPRTLLAIWVGSEMKQFMDHGYSSNQLSFIILLFLISLIGIYKIFSRKD